jgi:hypothetical protein
MSDDLNSLLAAEGLGFCQNLKPELFRDRRNSGRFLPKNRSPVDFDPRIGLAERLKAVRRPQFPAFGQISGSFSRIRAYPSLGYPVKHNLERVPSPKDCAIVMGQRKRRSHMHLPPPTMIRDLRSKLDQALDEPFHRPFDFFAHEVELAEHVEEVVGQHSHEQSGLVGRESMATRLIPTQRVLPLFDPIFHVPTSIVHLDYLPSRKLGIGHNEPDPREEFSVVPFDLRDNSAFSVPRLCPIPEINKPNLNSALGRSPHRARQIRVNESVQNRIGRKPDEVRDPFSLAILVHARVSKGCVSSKPEQDESGPIPLVCRQAKWEF